MLSLCPSGSHSLSLTLSAFLTLSLSHTLSVSFSLCLYTLPVFAFFSLSHSLPQHLILSLPVWLAPLLSQTISPCLTLSRTISISHPHPIMARLHKTLSRWLSLSLLFCLTLFLSVSYSLSASIFLPVSFSVLFGLICTAFKTISLTQSLYLGISIQFS